VLRLLGLDVDPQFRVDVGGRRYRADFRVRGTRVLVEFDGAVKYSDPRALFEEKQREDAIRRQGWVVVRIVWADLDHPERIVRLIDEARGRFAD
jgi:very-short-patch-repair endonuclease